MKQFSGGAARLGAGGLLLPVRKERSDHIDREPHIARRKTRHGALLGGFVLLSIALFMPVAAQAVECTNAGAGGSGSDGGTASNVTCGVGSTTSGASTSVAVGNDAIVTSGATGGVAVGGGTALNNSALAGGASAIAIGGGTSTGTGSTADAANAIAIGGTTAAGNGAGVGGASSIASTRKKSRC